MAKIESNKKVLITGWLLAVAALLGTGILSIVNWHSGPYIAENERQVLLRTLNSVIPPNTYSNNILLDTITVNNQSLLGSKKPITVYRARNRNAPIAIAMKVVAPNGYSGPIDLLVGINYSGNITGVRVVKHRETPGLGDGIEIQRSNWIETFTGKSINNPSHEKWKVKRDGGYFDQLTGATITPRAIVDAVHKSLLFFDKNRQLLFNNTANDEKADE